ncbi:hypothetical protein H1P_2670013 [Hyella patelloides LEGE 07179]|uniref:Reverse transcriptase domain-containing protein n=1 Tax=Hyella patelloides LEGE 07179 TaxID=945734 RepID=A0A563VSW1_9CYAN|nr:hypothetical protein H1P_2670013 [Hyella patelloides LEGE 07179]
MLFSTANAIFLTQLDFCFVDIAFLVQEYLGAKLNRLFSALVNLSILPIILSYFCQSDLVVLDNGETIFPNEGTPQGGIISPLLANIALHGMESRIKEYAATWKGCKRDNKMSLSLIRYADDFVIIHKDQNVVKNCQRIIGEWLSVVGGYRDCNR